MLRPFHRQIWLSSLLLATATSLGAQGVEVTSDSSSTSDTTRASAGPARDGRNWFVSLLRKISRRSDDSLSLVTATNVIIPSESADTSVSTDAPENAVPMPRAVRKFKSRRDSLEWRAARNVAQRSTGYR